MPQHHKSGRFGGLVKGQKNNKKKNHCLMGQTQNTYSKKKEKKERERERKRELLERKENKKKG